MKTAVVLFNLGGPDALSSVKPFLFNLFHDPAIIGVPQPFRYLIAKLISGKRDKTAQEIYEQMGGKSTLLEQTMAQAEALETRLKHSGEYRVFISMRYWHPMSVETVAQVKDYAPESIILLPLYPQFSTTTTGSSLQDWHRAAQKAGLNIPTHAICCYPTESQFIEGHAKKLTAYYQKALPFGKPRVLFSAHGLPEKVIAKGDPYQWQVEQTVEAIIGKMDVADMDYQVCYQSRVGPMKWIGPATDQEIIRAAKESIPLVIVPVAFVSEHSETLVELDIEYRHLAEEYGLNHYFRVPALSVMPDYISQLESICLGAKGKNALCHPSGARICPQSFTACPVISHEQRTFFVD